MSLFAQRIADYMLLEPEQVAPLIKLFQSLGVMIAWQGFLEFNSGETLEVDEADIKPYERTDDVEVKWIDNH